MSVVGEGEEREGEERERGGEVTVLRSRGEIGEGGRRRDGKYSNSCTILFGCIKIKKIV